MVIIRNAVMMIVLSSNVALSAPFYRKCTFINSQESPFELIIDPVKKTILLYGDMKAGIFMILDKEVGMACDQKILHCGSIAFDLKGDLSGKHSVIVDNNIIKFTAQNYGDGTLWSDYNLKTNIINFGSIRLNPAYCVTKQDKNP